MLFQLLASSVMMMNKTKIYIADTKALSNSNIFELYYKNVSCERQKKIDSFIFKKDKMLSLGAELLLKKALSDFGVHKFDVSYKPYGKPYIKDSGLCFNLSHSEEKVMCVVSENHVGCDVEKITDIELEIAKRFFYTTEYDEIAKLKNVSEQKNMFFRLWTLKESFMKATGLGMKLALDSFRIDLSDEITVIQNVSKHKYYFKEFDFNDGYKYAVCSLNKEFDAVKFVLF